jgi:hypothetical protein
MPCSSIVATWAMRRGEILPPPAPELIVSTD